MPKFTHQLSVWVSGTKIRDRGEQLVNLRKESPV